MISNVSIFTDEDSFVQNSLLVDCTISANGREASFIGCVFHRCKFIDCGNCVAVMCTFDNCEGIVGPFLLELDKRLVGR